MSDDPQQLKKAIREQAHAARNALPNKDELSRVICERLAAIPEYARAHTVMYYVDVRSEVRTRHYLPTALTQDKRVVVPYCVNGELELFHLQNMDELAVGMYKILEPKAELRALANKRVEVGDLDLVIVPGVAFDRDGGRTGHGFGYYDKLLNRARPDAPLIALAFECQLFPRIPMQTHDVFMDKVITETAVYAGKGRSAGG
ncbi:MAG TPA: 5-formyltetrahydrofolate cyclo-ligase [Planctomycetales bacterium]|jgi:5-formyltetrahydrofolate cyclo-ligase|nr:5-formyltetrahydrofolate cyclo-ligase [Planctomycetales bacterium]